MIPGVERNLSPETRHAHIWRVLADCCKKNVVQASPDLSVREVIVMMEEKNIGCVVVTERGRPVGIVTDRDLALRVLGKKRDPETTPVKDVMTRNPMVLRENLGLYEAMQKMRGKAFRRIPVVDESGHLQGIITLDDMVRLLTAELSVVTTILDGQKPAV